MIGVKQIQINLPGEKFKANIQDEIDEYENNNLIDFNKPVIKYEKYSLSTRIINDITEINLSENRKPLDNVEEIPRTNMKKIP